MAGRMLLLALAADIYEMIQARSGDLAVVSSAMEGNEVNSSIYFTGDPTRTTLTTKVEFALSSSGRAPSRN
jgi:hypothetical protein